MGAKEVLDSRKVEHEVLLGKLIAAKPARFDDALPTTLPKSHGLYAISLIGAADGEYLHVGKTRDGRSGLLGRTWEQHYKTGGSAGDLVEKVKARGHGADKGQAQEYIRRNCQVQWVVVEDSVARIWAEHYVLSVLRPLWGS